MAGGVDIGYIRSLVGGDLVMRKKFKSSQTKKPDKALFLLSLALTIIGLVALTDASAPIALRDFGDKFYFVKQQAVWAVMGIILLIVVMHINYTFWEKFATPLFLANLVLLIVVLIPGIGSSLLGARRWIVVGNFSIQPSELLKLSISVYLAKVASKDKKLAAFFVPILLSLILVMLEPDLGTSVLVVGISMIQIFISGVPLLPFFAASILGVIFGILLILSSDYRKERLLTFFEQTQDPLGSSYHIRQILIALGSGGLFGVGLGHSRQKYLFLPETATDSIFAVIAEEVGFFISSGLVILFFIFVIKGIKIANSAPDKFSRILAIGITSWVGLQVFLNIGSMVALVPLTGIPLPFISYGGSALTSLLVACGILLNISRYAKG